KVFFFFIYIKIKLKGELVMLKESSILRIPGPSPIPPSIQRAMSQPMIGHRGSETSELMGRIKPELKKVFGPKQDVMIITGSGTAGTDTAAVKIVSQGDEEVVLVSGSVGDRVANICETYEMKTHLIEVEWCEHVVEDDVADFLEKNKNLRAFFMTQCETSSGI